MLEVDKVEDLEFRWGKKRGIGGKKRDVQFYESFIWDGVEYCLYDCVYLYEDGVPEPYIGKLIKIWEHSNKIKRVKVLWFFRPSEIVKYLEGVEGIIEDELFLASGEGLGLANVNPLESIAGKCNVVCISKDVRNPQPSNDELQMADFVFYRTFDVGCCKVLHKIDGNIAGIEVKNIFNRVRSQKSNDLLKVDLDEKERGNAIRGDQSVISPNLNAQDENRSKKTDGSFVGILTREDEVSKASLMKQISLLDEKHVSYIDAEPGEMVRTDDTRENICNSKTIEKSRVDDDMDLKVSLLKEKSSKGEKPALNAGVKLVGAVKMNERQDTISNDKKCKESAKSKVLLAKQKSSLGVKLVSNLRSEVLEMVTTDDGPKSISNDKIRLRKEDIDKRESEVGKLLDSKLEANEKFKSTKDSSELDDRPHKKLKLDGFVKGSDDKSKHSMVDNKTNHKKLEVTRRPDAERSRWFIGVSWEERMQTAHEQGTLVLLQNLDPNYTSDEVEDIVWHCFKVTCTAKMVQQTGVSSPFSGQAFVVFKTREAAEKVVTKLDEGCLLLSNGRPLVGSFANPCFLEEPSEYFGYLEIDELKHQMQRGMRQAVSTSHCSQPNTIEYDMAMEWCLLQDRFDDSWAKLYEQQRKEWKKLRANFKSK